jgi:hypothetical protein
MVGRETKQFVRMVDAVRTESGNAPQDSGPGKALLYEKVYKSFIEGSSVAFISFADENAHEHFFANKFGHGDLQAKMTIN